MCSPRSRVGYQNIPIDLSSPPAEDDVLISREGILAEHTFSIRLIVKEILKYLEVCDLLRSSLVNKKLHLFCRQTLRENRRCMTVIDGENTCRDLKELSCLLENSPFVPFNGLSISAHPVLSKPTHTCLEDEDLLECESSILRTVEIKYLAVRVDGLSPTQASFSQTRKFPFNCVSMDFAREVLRKRAEYLEELRLFGDEVLADECYMGVLVLDGESLRLPNVRHLELPSRLYSSSYFNRLYHSRTAPDSALNKLIAASPRLEEIRGAVTTKCLQYFGGTNLARLVKELHLVPYPVPVETLRKFALANPELERLKFSSSSIETRCGNSSHYGPWIRPVDRSEAMSLLKLLLESSRKSLKMLALDCADVGYIVHHWTDIPVLEKVKYLRLAFSEFTNLPNVWVSTEPGLRKLEWAKHFPALEEVHVDYYFQEGNGFNNDLLMEVMQRPEEYSCLTVRKITFTLDECETVHPMKLHLFRKVFPNVKTCLVKGSWKKRGFELSKLWYAWPELEDIGILGLPPDNDYDGGNYDEDFMGICRQEATYLKEKFENFESMAIVPVKPNILNFRNLQKVVLQIDHGIAPGSLSAPAFLSPQVCSWMLDSMPGVALEVDTFCRFRETCGEGWEVKLDHLSRFAKFVRHDFRPYF